MSQKEIRDFLMDKHNNRIYYSGDYLGSKFNDQNVTIKLNKMEKFGIVESIYFKSKRGGVLGRGYRITEKYYLEDGLNG